MRKSKVERLEKEMVKARGEYEKMQRRYELRLEIYKREYERKFCEYKKAFNEEICELYLEAFE